MRAGKGLGGGAGLVLLFVVQWFPFLFLGRSFYFRDLTFFSTPLLVETARQWKNGVVPAWNPHLASGAPLAADPNAQAFFPDMALLVLFGADAPAVQGILLLRLFLVPLAAYLALRAAPLDPASAFLGAALVSLSGPLATTLSSFPAHLAGMIVFIPLAVAGYRLAEGGIGAILAGAACLALGVLSGSPELALQGAAVFAICALRRPLGRAAAAAAAAFAGGALLSAPQWLPALQLYPRTPRALGWELGTPPGFLSFPPLRLAELIWPGFLGDPAAESPAAYWGRGLTEGVTPYLLSVAVGIVPLALAPAAARHPLGRRLLAAAGLFTLLGLGRFLPGGEVIARTPLGSLRYPEKWLMGAGLALAAAAAVGVSVLVRDPDGPRRRGPALAAAAILLLSAALGTAAVVAPDALVGAMRVAGGVDPALAGVADASVLEALRNGAAQVGLAALALVAILLLWRRGRLAPGLLVAVIAGVAIADRLPRVIGATPSAPAGSLTRETPETAIARSRSAGGRFFYDREATTILDPLRPFTGTLFGLSYAGNTDVDQFSDARSRAFASAAQGLSFEDPRKLGLLRLSGVRVVSTDDAAAPAARLRPIAGAAPGRRLFEMDPAGDGRLYYQAAAVSGLEDAMRHLLARGLPMDTVGVVERSAGIASAPADHRLGPLRMSGPDAFTQRVETSARGLLLIPVTYDPGWSVRVNGETVPAVPVDAAFLGVWIPPGAHEVSGVYSAPGLRAGVALAGAAAIAGLAAVLISRRRVRASASPRPA